MSLLPTDDTLLIRDADDRKLIQQSYRTLLHCFKKPLNEEDQKSIRLAYELAVRAHSKQRRKSGEPYILHPIAVAQICAEEIGLGPTSIVCALLHDVVEDTDVTLAEIEKMFGSRISRIVDGLTKLDKTYLSEAEAGEAAESHQAKNFQKVLTTLTTDVRVVIIKMADRLHNLRTIGAMPNHKQIKIAAETTYVYGPLAHRLGLYNIKTEFQDLCMKITDRETYDEIANKLQETKRSRTAYIDKFTAPIKEVLDAEGVPYRIIGRPKSIYSIWNKIKGKKVNFDEIYDLFAIRIIVDVPHNKEKSTCWQAYSWVTDVYRPVPERLKDWVTTPKSNGYESLHTTVVGPEGRFVEVQIRSERMNDISERGFAAHWKYKGLAKQQDVFETWIEKLRELLDDGTSNNAVQFLEDFKTNLFQEEVYVFTPAGDMRMLPKGATALDFAFDIHSDVGCHCTAIKIDNVLVPMSYKLQNGEQVTIITSKNQKPNEGWLKMVVTGKARSRIRAAMKDEQRKQGELGKEALQRKLKSLKVDFEENVEFLVKHFGFRTRLDLYYNISIDNINLQQDMKGIKVENNRLAAEVNQQEVAPAIISEKPPKSSKSENKPHLLINGESASLFDYSLATCCNPVMGDPVFAFLTVGQGMKIHRYACSNANNLLSHYDYRVMKAEWGNTGNQSFVAQLRIIGIDDGVGVIERLSNKISTQLGLNIRTFFIDGNDGYFEGRVSIVVSNVNQLNQAIIAIKSLENVSSVTREE